MYVERKQIEDKLSTLGEAILIVKSSRGGGDAAVGAVAGIG